MVIAIAMIIFLFCFIFRHPVHLNYNTASLSKFWRTKE
jgi:hypothetical protein